MNDRFKESRTTPNTKLVEHIAALTDEAELQLARDIQERREIYSRYEKGRAGQEIDPWEDPDFELYKVTDRYGFVHDQHLQSPDFQEEKSKLLELKRETKWLKMRSNWERFYHTPKLRQRIWKGIPDRFRAETWARLLRLEQVRQGMVYQNLLERAEILSEHLKQIDLDINRTYRNHIMFRMRYDVKQQSLFRLLAAYSMYNTEVGYCQGMSQVAALLLMYLNEEDAFWALHTLMVGERHAMHGLFIPGFPKLLRFQAHVDKILKKLLPKVKKNQDKNQIFTALYSTKWFFQCFLDRVPFTLALRLWDVFILDGDRIMLAMAYNIMKMHKKVLAKTNFEQTMDFLQVQLEKNFLFTDDEAMQSLRNCMEELRSAKLLPPPQGTEVELPKEGFGAVLSTPMQTIRDSAVRALERQRVKPPPVLPALSPKRVSGPQTREIDVGVPVAADLYPNRKASHGVGRETVIAEDGFVRDADVDIDELVAPVPTMPSPSRVLLSESGEGSPLPTTGHGVTFRQLPTYKYSEEPQSARTYNGRPSSMNSTSLHVAGPVRHTESFYDNVGGQVQNAGGGDIESSEEHIEYAVTPTDHGGTAYTTQYTKTVTNVTSYVIQSDESCDSIASEVAKRRGGGVRSEPGYDIYRAPNNVTVVEIHTDDPRRSLTASPGKFPVSPTDFNGYGSHMVVGAKSPEDYGEQPGRVVRSSSKRQTVL